MRQGAFPAATIRTIGLANPQAVRLSMAPDVPADVRSHIFKVAEGIANGRIRMPESYDGAEFATPA